jgi:hypothetical protein
MSKRQKSGGRKATISDQNIAEAVRKFFPESFTSRFKVTHNNENAETWKALQNFIKKEHNISTKSIVVRWNSTILKNLSLIEMVESENLPMENDGEEQAIDVNDTFYDLKILIAKIKEKDSKKPPRQPRRKPEEVEPYGRTMEVEPYGRIRQLSPAMVGWDCSVQERMFFQTETSAPSVETTDATTDATTDDATTDDVTTDDAMKHHDDASDIDEKNLPMQVDSELDSAYFLDIVDVETPVINFFQPEPSAPSVDNKESETTSLSSDVALKKQHFEVISSGEVFESAKVNLTELRLRSMIEDLESKLVQSLVLRDENELLKEQKKIDAKEIEDLKLENEKLKAEKKELQLALNAAKF